MKKIILTSVLALCMACPSYATTLTGSGNECNEPILNTDTGPAELRAIWGANTINLEWYSDNTLLDVQQSADTCLYDGAITLPSTNPTKTGYTFGGWRVRSTGFDLSTLASYIDTNGTAHGFSRLNGSAGSNESTYGLTVGSGEWAVEFSYGTVKGIARCSSTSGTYAQTGTPSETTGQYCWCQASGFDAEKDGTYMSVASPSWVFDADGVSAYGCANYCAYYCADFVQNNSGFRRAMYGVGQ